MSAAGPASIRFGEASVIRPAPGRNRIAKEGTAHLLVVAG
jgi:hypothetical protein